MRKAKPARSSSGWGVKFQVKEFSFSFKVYLEQGEWIVIFLNLLVSSLLWHKKYCVHFAAKERNFSLVFFLLLVWEGMVGKLCQGG